MEKRFTCSKEVLSHTRVTFWVYAASTPIVIFLYMLPYIRAGKFVFSPFSLIYVAVAAYLLFGTYRAFRALLSTKKTFCVIDGDRVYGVSTPNPYKKSIPFEILKSDIRGIGKTTVSVGGLRSQPALALNTDHDKVILFAIDRIDELRNELET